ncbi:hypothetical protein ACOI1H_16220 [Loktanella sp. DJP18]|uniref:hypothetical protein n=1 Tax=Loktanella sp. DJP18 TaxID=3409788 RepID=UPI003BB5CD7F
MPNSTQDPMRQITTKDGGTTHEISRDVIVKAVIEWDRTLRTGSGYAALGHDVDHLLGNVWKGPWAFARAADAIIQRMRKAGWLEKGQKRGSWAFTTEGHAAIRHLKSAL